MRAPRWGARRGPYRRQLWHAMEVKLGLHVVTGIETDVDSTVVLFRRDGQAAGPHGSNLMTVASISKRGRIRRLTQDLVEHSFHKQLQM